MKLPNCKLVSPKLIAVIAFFLAIFIYTSTIFIEKRDTLYKGSPAQADERNDTENKSGPSPETTIRKESDIPSIKPSSTVNLPLTTTLKEANIPSIKPSSTDNLPLTTTQKESDIPSIKPSSTVNLPLTTTLKESDITSIKPSSTVNLPLTTTHPRTDNSVVEPTVAIALKPAPSADRDDSVAKVLVPHPVPSEADDVCQGNNDNLPPCPRREFVSDKTFNVSLEILSSDELVRRHGNDLGKGGHFRPANCKPDQKVAIVIPYRDRQDNLKRFLNNIHPFLKKQNVEYTLFVVEQLPGFPFNRGMIINLGFFEARKICNFDCFIIHDNDLAPDDNGNLYRCGDQPRQHARDLPRWEHKPPYADSFGGVVSMKPEQFIKMNGFSNTYFVWGREDDELGRRVEYYNMTRDTVPFNIGSYKEFDHKKVKKYDLSFNWYPNWKSRLENDGLTSLHYELRGVVHTPLYTHIFANINLESVRKAYNGKIVAAGKDDQPLPDTLMTSST